MVSTGDCRHGVPVELRCGACEEPTDVSTYKQVGAVAAAVSDIDAVLTERGSRYGAFTGHAQITQAFKVVTARYLRDRSKSLADDQQEALDMIFHKIGRIINGDPDYADSWVDIAGYAKLVADRLEGKER